MDSPKGCVEGGTQESPQALDFWTGGAKKVGIASGEHDGFYCSEVVMLGLEVRVRFCG